MPPQDLHAPVPTGPDNSAAARHTILIVDDERPIRDLLASIFEEAGYAVLTASDGRAAAAIAGQQPVSLVLTDLMLPIMDGQELCRHLRADPRTARLPILLMTAARDPQVSAPFTDVIAKPFDIDEVLRQVERHLRGQG